MSAAVNRTHDVLSSRPHLPLTGELHPLRREFERLLAMGNMIALTFALLASSIVYFWPREAAVDVPGFVKEHKVIDQLPPIDPISGRNDTKYEPPPPSVQHGTYVPGEPDSAISELPPGPGGDGEGDPIGDPFEGWSPGDSIAVHEPAAPPEVYEWWDEAPVFLTCKPPVYPEIVRDAGIDGTVHVRVLVSVNGKVKNAYVVDGPPALRESALESARSSLFKPALAKGHPVEVWVVIPISFQLQARY